MAKAYSERQVEKAFQRFDEAVLNDRARIRAYTPPRERAEKALKSLNSLVNAGCHKRLNRNAQARAMAAGRGIVV